MKLTIIREALLKPLQTVISIVEKRHTMAILSNVLFELNQGLLRLTATDIEVELVATVAVEGNQTDCRLTLPARKLLDIVRSLPDESMITLIEGENHRVTLQSGRSRFVLSGLAADEFPKVDSLLEGEQLVIPQNKLQFLLKRTAFSMANQDVRYFLNGLLFEMDNDALRVVATDGHRLATTCLKVQSNHPLKQVIIPRKAVLELLRLVEDNDQTVNILLGKNHIRFSLGEITFTSKLLDGRYPDYKRVIPSESENVLLANRLTLKNALSRTAILSNEKYRGVRLQLTPNKLKLSANNPEHEEAQDEIEVQYQGEDIDIGFNVSYLLDVLNVVEEDTIRMTLAHTNSSALLRGENDTESLYVVMPIRL